MNDLSKWATWREIHAQPSIWAEWGDRFDPSPMRKWIASLDVEEIWFCGAGTSAYIGDIIVAGLEGQTGPRLRSVPSTDLVSRPLTYLKNAKPLIVNFGRSGDSAESIGTLDAIAAIAPDLATLNITCNGESALATRASNGPSQVIVLPEATHDAGFAMTSSFSTMLLTALALFDEPCDFKARMKALASQFTQPAQAFVEAAEYRPDRAVFVGSGPLAFAAREAALKVLELSAGEIPAQWDSTLGFRHGPKSLVTDDTQITVFMAQDAPTNAYDADLVDELRIQFPSARVVTIGPAADIKIDMPFGPAWAAPICVAYAQIVATIWSEDLGLNVDDPFKGRGTLSRVVSGVKLYPVAS